MKPTTYKLRQWQRRADTLERNASALTSDMIDVAGVDYEMMGENFTSQADDVVATSANLASYLEACIRSAKQR